MVDRKGKFDKSRGLTGPLRRLGANEARRANEWLALGEDAAMQRDRLLSLGRRDMFPRTRLAFAAALLFGAAATPALSQTEDEYAAACQDDALRLCSEHVPDHAKIKSCLIAHKASLTPACRTLVSPAKRRKKG
jgi:hypothetical protein